MRLPAAKAHPPGFMPSQLLTGHGHGAPLTLDGNAGPLPCGGLQLKAVAQVRTEAGEVCFINVGVLQGQGRHLLAPIIHCGTGQGLGLLVSMAPQLPPPHPKAGPHTRLVGEQVASEHPVVMDRRLPLQLQAGI